jgi:glycosyltransferase involved in cell wall biosynthesis
MHICFLVGSLAISGGTYVILQHASYLRRAGHTVTLAVQDPMTPEMFRWHDAITDLECVTFAEGRKRAYDLVIATWWNTALQIDSFQSECAAYFVQSIESRFYPPEEGMLRQLVDRTYDLPISYITEADWIRHHLDVYHSQQAAVVRNGIRKDVYRLSGTVLGDHDRVGSLRVLVEGHFGVPFKNTALAIKLAKHAGIRDIWVLTGSPVSWLPGVQRVFSRLPVVQTAEIYRSCDVLLKLSTVEGMFGPPLEMFHCGGTAIVFDVTGHEEYIRDGANALVIRRGDIDGVKTALRRVAADRQLLTTLQCNALRTADAWPSWEQSSAAFESWILDSATLTTRDNRAIRERVAAALCEFEDATLHRYATNPVNAAVRRSLAVLRRLTVPLKPSWRKARILWEVIKPGLQVK